MATLCVLKNVSKLSSKIALNSHLDKVLVVRTISNGNVDKVLGNHSAFPKLIKHSQLHLNTRTFCRTTCLLIKSAVPPLSSDSIDDFRASEQKNEQEFTSQQRSSDSQEKSQKSNDEEDQKRVQEVRCRILDAALEHVSSHGWSREAITIGAEKCGYPGIAHGMFPNGGAELVHHFYTKCNNQLIDQLREEESARGEGESTPIPTEFISRAIKLRLQMIQPYIDSWPKALAILTLPQNAPTSLAQLLTLIDDICYYAGDRSVDFGWYTRRIGVATIYKMTELYMLQDKSKDHEDTWEFLHRRIEDGVHLQEVLNTSEESTRNVAHAVGSAFETARNILGINFNKR